MLTLSSDLEERQAGLDADGAGRCGFCRQGRTGVSPVDGGSNRALYQTRSISGNTFTLTHCGACGAVFLDPRPTAEQLDRAYDEAYYGAGEAKFSGPIERVLDHFRSRRVRTVRKFVAPPAAILDIGCGSGGFLGYLMKHGYHAYGTELPGKAAARAARVPGLRLEVGPLAAEGFGDAFFDAVCMWHVFEHLTEPQKMLRIIRRILKPGGHLMISMPNIDSLQSRLFRGNWLHLDPPKHLFFLAPRDLESVMNEHGFELLAEKHFSLEQNPFGMQQSLLNCVLGQREVLFEALKGGCVHQPEYYNRAPPKTQARRLCHRRFSILLQKLFCLGSFPLFLLLAALEAGLGKGGTMELIFRKRPQR